MRKSKIHRTYGLLEASKPWIADLPEYVPGKAAKRDAAGKLSSNESPFAPSEHILEAVSKAGRSLNRYPDPLATEVREALAEKLWVSEKSILVGNGSDELIYLIALAYLSSESRVVVADPPYLMQEIAGRALGAKVVKVPLKNYRHDLVAMSEIDADLAFIPNPHNPSGTVVSQAEIERFLETSSIGLVIVDEAYVDFVDDLERTSSLPLVASGRVAVLRTFSKLYGLAGARIGYMVAPSEIVGTLRKLRPPFSVNALGQAAAFAALGETESVEEIRLLVREIRKRMTAAFEKAGYTVVPSQANFVLVQAPDERELLARLEAAELMARPGSTLGLPGHVRVSVASPATLEQLEETLTV